MGKWEMVRLGDVVDLLNGFAFKSENYSNNGIRVIRITNVQKGFIEDLHPQFYPIEEANGKYHLFENDLLISLTGNVGRVALISKQYLPAVLNQRVACLRIRNELCVDKNYVFSFLNSNIFENDCIVSSKGMAQKNMSTEWLKQYKIPLPPLDEQKRIAKNLNLASEIVKGYKEQLTELDKLVQSVFYEMFNGIKQTVKLSHYIKTLTAGKSLAGTEPCINKVLKTGAVSYDCFDKSAVKYLPLEYTPIKENLVKEGTVIISRMNTIDLVGAAAYVWDVEANTYLPDRLWRAELFEENANPIFIWQVLIQESTKRQVRKVASGTSGSMKNISKPNLLNITVMDVPFPLQTRFAEIVTEIEAQKAQVQQALTEAENLFNSLMQEYFE